MSERTRVPTNRDELEDDDVRDTASTCPRCGAWDCPYQSAPVGPCYGCGRETNGNFKGTWWCGWCNAPQPGRGQR